MMQQSQPVVPPQVNDGRLRDFSQIVQGNLMALFQAAHSHPVQTTFPLTTDGQPGDIYSVLTGGQYWIVVKFSKTLWVKFGPGTAL